MRLAVPLLLLSWIAGAPAIPEPSIPYFTNVRDVRITHPDRQNFFIVDEEIWSHSRPDLGDLRLYEGESLVQYALSEQQAGLSSQEVDAKILNLGNVAGQTEFDLDVQGLAEYDRVHLRLDAKDFVVTAFVSGGSGPGQAADVELTPSTIYDFTKEQLGSNFQLKLPVSSFRYLHVRLTRGIRPEQVKGATISNLQEQQANWTTIGSCRASQQTGNTTIIACEIPAKVPLNRIALQVDPAQVNFRRSAWIEDGKGERVAAGDVSRVRVNRGGTLVTNENLAISVVGTSGPISLVIDNGENPPLAIAGAEPQVLERRIYFDPQGKALLRLYYGDEKLGPPAYDYGRFFHVEASQAQAQLGAGEHNPQYTARPDERPWSERHTGVLWGAMLFALLTLTILALRGLRA
jgi:hypothetical protein